MSNSETLASISNLMVYCAIAVYGLAFLSYAADAARRTSRLPQPALASLGLASAPASNESAEPMAVTRSGATGISLTCLGLLLNLAALIARAAATQRAPWGNMYEFTIAGTVAVSAAYLLLLLRRPVVDFGIWVAGLILLALGCAVALLYTPATELVPVLNSYWLVVHVAAAIIAGGVFTVGAVATVLYLVRVRLERHAVDETGATRRRYAAILPSATVLEQVAHGAVVFALPVWTFAVLAGAIWAENSWGRYWGWDPKETWAFITWVLYAAYLHAQATAGWRGGRAATFAVLGYLAFLFNFFGVNLWLPGLHSYAGV